MKSFTLFLSILLVMALPAIGQITVDGSLDAGYTSYCDQNTPTGFGDNNVGLTTWANGSELDAGYAYRDGSSLCFMLTGNLETNFNKLDIFIDCLPGGQNTLRGDNPNVDFDGLNRMGDNGSDPGLTFDTGFEADYYFTCTAGDVGGGTFEMFANMSEVLTSGGGSGMFLGGSGGGNTTITAGNGITIGINNSNIGGVDGAMVNTPSSVTTGIEWCIPLSVLGNPTGDIKITAFINGGGHDYLSNQVLCGVNGAGNLAEPRQVNFNNLPGDQYFTVPAPPAAVPTLGEWGLIIFALLLLTMGTVAIRGGFRKPSSLKVYK